MNTPPLDHPRPRLPVITSAPPSHVLRRALEPGPVAPCQGQGLRHRFKFPAKRQRPQQLSFGPFCSIVAGPGDSPRDPRLPAEASMEENQAASRQVERNQGEETDGFPPEVSLEFQQELGHASVITDVHGVRVEKRAKEQVPTWKTPF